MTLFAPENPEANASAAAPLGGITVIELGSSAAAPFAGQILADLGATVIKVENPERGDDARGWGPPDWQGASSSFQALNRNKQSVTIDLKTPDGVAALKRLSLHADIVLQNMRPGMVEKYGIDAESLRRDHPSLIYFNLGAFGDVGPLKERVGYDPLMQAFAGIMDTTGEPGRPPVRVGPSIIDFGSGLWGVIGILAALVRRRDTGDGCTINGSLYETALSWMTLSIAGLFASGKEPGRSGSEAPIQVPSKAFETADGYVVIAAGNDNLFRKLCVTLGAPDWPADPRFTTNADRIANRKILNTMIESITQTAISDHWVESLNAAGVPCAPTQSVSKVVAHAQTKALDILSLTADGAMGFVRLPLKFDGHRPRIRKGPPALGAHNHLLQSDET